MNHNIHILKLSKPFQTESGFVFEQTELAWKSWGTLNAEKDNVLLICHALTGHAAADEWFSGLFDEHSPFNLSPYYVVCINTLGSIYGSTGPWSLNPKTGKPYKNDFPEITIRDMVAFQQQWLDEKGINGIQMVMGPSLGGLVALEFALMDSRIKSAAVIAAGAEHKPWAIAYGHAQRTAIVNDPKWKNGKYEKDSGPDSGLSLARMIAMISYRSPDDFQNKFGRNIQPDSDIFAIESYLNHQGNKFIGRFDALAYLRITSAMDTHDVGRNRGGIKQALGALAIPVLVVGIPGDGLYPLNEQEELFEFLPNATLKTILSSAGHDAFLIEFGQLAQHLHAFTQSHSFFQ